jgi:predicted NBD/HSP70 family sugar kinase
MNFWFIAYPLETPPLRQLFFQLEHRKQGAEDILKGNTRALLAAIARQPGTTAADLARATGLSASSVSRILEQMIAKGLVQQGGPVRGRRGQPGVKLHINADGAYSVGCQIDFDTCYMLIRSLGGDVIAEGQFSTVGKSYCALATSIGETFERLVKNCPNRVSERLVGLGVTYPADFLRLSNPQGVDAENIWDEKRLKEELERQLNVEVGIYLSGCAGAWAELVESKPPGPADYIYIFVDQFVQTGLLLDGRLWISPSRAGGGIGGIRIREGGQSMLLHELVGEVALKHALESASESAKGEALNLWLDRAAFGLAQALRPIVETLSMPLVILDGILDSSTLSVLVDRLGAILAENAWSPAPSVRLGLAGNHAPACGAAMRRFYTAFMSDEII